MNRLALLVLPTVAGLLAACASLPSAPLPVPTHLFDDSAFAPPVQPADAREVFAISPAMKRYLEVDIAPQLRTLGRQRGLVDALHRKAQLRLDYDTDSTRNAAEAFDARAGNCLSLVVMTAALAKHLELPVSYQALVGQETWSRSGDLSMAMSTSRSTNGWSTGWPESTRKARCASTSARCRPAAALRCARSARPRSCRCS